jgi:hypothetical protein
MTSIVLFGILSAIAAIGPAAADDDTPDGNNELAIVCAGCTVPAQIQSACVNRPWNVICGLGLCPGCICTQDPWWGFVCI